MLVLISLLTTKYSPPMLEFKVVLASFVFVSPYLFKAWRGTLPVIRNTTVEDHFRHGWKFVATSLFTAVGGKKLASSTCILFVKICAGVAFVFILQGYVSNPNGLYAKLLVFAGCFLQLPIIMSILYGNLYPEDDLSGSIFLASAIVAALIILTKLGPTFWSILNLIERVFRYGRSVRHRGNAMPRHVAV
ncbi:hypothetical protein QVD17_14274 [Tagetes erecta]|uniref:Uncharacterized protein n=1 Tax=Tagetes erecta TaxID=13708 RepID=A0AAD8P3P6_TARER|nr:hypothetical protein QVD17_14272 [Tagetes erecta]KAK1431061.1 hypothetical protein QVD17_14274 [Tagetes erecta]